MKDFIHNWGADIIAEPGAEISYNFNGFNNKMNLIERARSIATDLQFGKVVTSVSTSKQTEPSIETGKTPI